MEASARRGNPLRQGAESIVGVSPWAIQIRADILRVAPHHSSVLITGPSGTGKELIAQAIHYHSSRCDKPLVAVDCAAVSGSLFASHLFGHVKGAFTGADHAALGCFRGADHGTVFLDEIGELEPEFQAKLLRVLQQRVVVPVGSQEEIPIDVRVIAATNCDLAQMVSSGRFRADLFYRVNVIGLQTIPLKERREDIDVLVRHISARLANHQGLPLKELSSHCMQRLRSSDWPGNVRELENYLERVALFDDEAVAARESRVPPPSPFPPPPSLELGNLSRSDIFSAVGSPANPTMRRTTHDLWPTLAEVEREHIRRTLDATGHNQSLTARLLNISRQQLVRKITRLGLDVSPRPRGRPRNAKG
jgi:transcriptional regulator with PAS, ATPase and Fis domain